MDAQEFFAKHGGRAMLSFSGGKDSTAVLWMLQPWWKQLEVVWMDAGDAPPELEAHVLGMGELVPHFRRLRSDAPTWRRANPVKNFLPCCWHNVWAPTLDYVLRREFSGLIRGVKSSDILKGPISSGELDGFGVQHWYPLWDLTDADVVSYLGDRMPPGYRGSRGLPDCRTCPTDFHSLQPKDIKWIT